MDEDSPNEIDDFVFTQPYSDSVPRISKAVILKNLKGVKKLLLSGCPPNLPDNQGFTSIHCCASAGDQKALKIILKHNPKSTNYLVNLKSWEGITPLMVAVKSSRPSPDMVRLLLDCGADPNARCHTGESSLHLACAGKGGLKIVRQLVEHGAQVNAKDLRSYTPLHVAIANGGEADLLKFLIDLTDLSVKNTHKRTPFLEACKANHTKAVQLLLEKDKSFANCENDVPPLVLSCLSGNFEMTQHLVRAGANVNIKCKAMVPNEPHKKEFILFDRENFLPIHSSLSNVKVFSLLLKMTKWKKLLELETNYYNFALFVLVYADVEFYEALLQSGVPKRLKTFDCQVLVKLILNYPDLEDVFSSKFLTLFKYNFSLTPENVFQSFANHMCEKVLDNSIRYLCALAKMGISSGRAFQSKSIVMRFLRAALAKKRNSQTCDETTMAFYTTTYDLLSVKVLSLQQLCRTVLRDHMKFSVQSDWLALRMVVDSKIPDHLKDFILFQDLKWSSRETGASHCLPFPKLH